MQVSEEALLPSGEWKLGHRRSHSDIDPDVSCFHFVSKAAGTGTAAGEKAGHVSEAAAVDEVDGLLNIRQMDQAHDGSEDLSSGKCPSHRNVFQDGGEKKVSRLQPGERNVSAIDNGTGPFSDSFSDQTGNTLLALWRYDWSHLDAFDESVARLSAAGGLYQAFRDLLMFSNRHDD